MIPELIGYSSIVMAFSVFGMCTWLVRRYRCTASLGKAFLFLGLAFAYYGTAETLWYYLDYHEIEPYQNYPDVLYVGYYLFGILHVIETLRYFRTRGNVFQLWEKITLPVVVVAISIVFVVLSHGADVYDILFALAFVVMAAILGTIALLGILRVFVTNLSITWILIGGSIIIASLVDIHYYFLETMHGYDYGLYPIIDMAWFVTDIIMVIGIVFHRRKI